MLKLTGGSLTALAFFQHKVLACLGVKLQPESFCYLDVSGTVRLDNCLVVMLGQESPREEPELNASLNDQGVSLHELLVILLLLCLLHESAGEVDTPGTDAGRLALQLAAA